MTDLTAEAFLVLRDTFFDAGPTPRTYKLRGKGNTQADPLDERIHETPRATIAQAIEGAASDAEAQVGRLHAVGRRLSRNDVRVVVMAHVIKQLSQWPSGSPLLGHLLAAEGAVESVIDRLREGTASR